MELYVDGVLGASATHTTASLTASDFINVGRIGGGDNYYKGWMADLQIWDRALSANEVVTYKESCPDYLAPGLLAIYTFSKQNNPKLVNAIASANPSKAAKDGYLMNFNKSFEPQVQDLISKSKTRIQEMSEMVEGIIKAGVKWEDPSFLRNNDSDYKWKRLSEMEKKDGKFASKSLFNKDIDPKNDLA